jgi:23S rRNA G2445 N2-methylase RlmL
LKPPISSKETTAPPNARAASQQRNVGIRFGRDLYAAQTQPGFEAVVWSEIAARIPDAREVGRRVAPGRAGMVLFSTARPDALKALRTAEDLFAIVGYGRGLGRVSPEKIQGWTRDARYVGPAIEARVHLMPGSRSGRRLSFRVVARLSGDHDFRRVDLQRAVERGIAARSDHKWMPAGDDAEVEFWATMIEDEFILAIRLSDERMRHREYKIAHRPASLRPAVAAAMGWLSEPRDDDIVLDPLCGAASVLIERAHLRRYRMLLGGDRDDDARAASYANIGPRYRPIAILPWDAAALPLKNASVTKIITNLPWGVKSGSHSANQRLYPRLLGEFRRVLTADGSMVLLTAQTQLMRDLIADGLLQVTRIFNVTILGAPAAVYVCRP